MTGYTAKQDIRPNPSLYYLYYHREYACAKNVIGEIRVNGVVVDKIKAEVAEPLEEYCCNICQKPFPDPNDPGMLIRNFYWGRVGYTTIFGLKTIYSLL